MMYAPYRPEKDYDEYFERLVKIADDRRDKDDDTIYFLTGLTGSGKTNWMFHFYELYDYENASMDYIALKRENFADALKRAKNYKGKRFVGYDEGNVSKRDSLTKWNKSVIDLLFAIRGLNICQLWCNPSVDMLDKVLVQEKINGLIFVATKSMDKPRLYYFFTKQQILDMLNKYERLTIEILKDKGKQHCSYIGWFKPYKGRLLEEYLKVKENRMESKIDDFQEQWGTKDGSIKHLTISDIAQRSGVSAGSIRTRQEELIKSNKLILNKDIIINPSGIRLYNESAIEIFKQDALERHKKNAKTINKRIKRIKQNSIDSLNIDMVGVENV